MAVNVIDTIKPKNQGSFPVVEAVDVKVTDEKRLDAALNDKADASDLSALAETVSGKASSADLAELTETVNGKAEQTDLEELSSALSEKADQTDLAALETVVNGKANTSDVTTATANLQAQINEIITPVTQDAEVENARVGADGTSYQTLKSRLDAEYAEQADYISREEKRLGETENAIRSTIVRSTTTHPDTIDITAYFEYTAGAMQADGTIVGATTYKRTQKIDVSAGDVITATQVFRYLAAFDNSGNIVSASGVDTSSTSYTVPSGIKSIIISFSNTIVDKLLAGTDFVYISCNSQYKFRYLDELELAEEKSSSVTIKISKDEIDKVDISNAIIFTNGAMQPDGSVVGANTYKRTQEIVVKQGDTIISTGAFRYLAAFNSSGEAVVASGVDTSSTSYTVPSGIKSIVISFSNTIVDKINSGTATVTKTTTITGEHYSFKYKGQLDKAVQQLEDMQHQIVAEAAAADKLPKYGENLAPAASTWTGTGGSVYSDDAWNIPVGGGVSIPITAEAEKRYYISVVVSDAITSVDVLKPLTFALGDDSISIFAANDANWQVVLTPTENATTLTISGTEWTGKIHSAVVKEIDEYALPIAKYNRIPMFSYGDNIAFGYGHTYLADGDNNTAYGSRAQENLNTGMWNTAVGTGTQRRITNGKGNTAVGQQAQSHLTTGCYNHAFGTSAQSALTNGCWNVAVGNEVQRDITSGCNNVGVGRRAMNSIVSGNGNIAIGSQAGFYPHETYEDNYQVLIGHQACKKALKTTRNDNAIAIGAYSQAGSDGIALGASVVADDNEIAIGSTTHTSVVIAGRKINFNEDGTVTWEVVE